MTGTGPGSSVEDEPIYILYVDDDPAVCDLVKDNLERVEPTLTVKTETDPETGIERLETEPFDCILSDFAMEPLNGLEFLEMVRVQEPDLPFILHTARGSELVASEAIAAGVTDYIQKGAGKEQYAVVANRIKQAVQQYRSTRERAAMQKRMELALSETNSLLFEIDLETGVVSRHGAVEQFLEVDPETIQTKQEFMEQVVHPADHELFRTFFESLQRGEKQSGSFEYRTNPDLGPVRWLRAHASLESPDRILGLVQEITDQKTREESLRQYKQAVESSKDLLAAVDENLTYLFTNKEYRAYHDIEETDRSGTRLPDVLTPSQFEEIEPKVTSALNGRPVQTTVTRAHPDGGERVLDVRLFPLRGDEGIQGVGASMRDVTSEKRLQRDLKRSKERYESLFKSIRDAILVADTDREIINCNPAFTDLFGYELAEIEGKQTEMVYANRAEYEAVGAALDGHFEDPTFTQVVEYEKKSGQTFPGETNVFYLRDAENEITGFIGIIKDVSDRRDRLTQLQMVDRILQHNFHNDITVIQGFAEYVLDESTPPVSTAAETIHETAARLLGTVEKEREITKFLSDPPPTESVAIRAVCEAAVERVRTEYPQAPITTSYTGDPTVEATVAIETAIEELLENSLIHSAGDDQQVTLALRETDGAVLISVRDTNQQIPEMEHTVITGEEPPSPLYHGSGMGLWLVSLIVKHAGGTLEFDENHPAGNIVTIRLFGD